MGVFRRLTFSVFVFLFALFVFSCHRGRPAGDGREGGAFFTVADDETAPTPGERGPGLTGGGGEFAAKLNAVIQNAELPGELAGEIRTVFAQNPAFIVDLLICLENDRYLRELVDKRHPLRVIMFPAIW